MAETGLTPTELQQIWEMIWNKLQENGTDYSDILVAPTTADEWSQIKIICKDERVANAAKACNIDLKAVLDAYAVDVNAVSAEVKAAKASIDASKKSIDQTANRLTGAGGLEERLTGAGGLEERLTGAGGLEERMNAVASNATSAATNAQGSAARAEKAAGKASSIAGSAADYAKDASHSALDANRANQSALSAESHASSAASSASASAKSAEGAATTATDCKTHIDSVKSSIDAIYTNVSASELIASDSAAKASNSETNAAGSEQRAKGYADSIVGANNESKKVLAEAQALATQTTNDKTDIALMKSAVERIYQDSQEGGIYGVDFNMVTGQATRIDASVGLEFHRFIGGAGSTPIPVANSFMNLSPWSGIYQTLRTVEGNNLVARSGDANFESALRSGECNLFTCIPRYYVKMETPVVNGQAHWILHVSGKPFAGAFSVIEGDSVEIASIVTAERNEKHVSQPGLVPLINTTANTFENKAELQGLYNSSWNDFLSWWILMLVQTANMNSQNAVGRGVCSMMYSSDPSYKCQEPTSAGNTIVVQDKGYKVGMNIYLGSNWYNGSVAKGRTIINMVKHSNGSWLILTIDGDPVTTTTDTFCVTWGQSVTAEAILAMGLDCGYYKPTAEWSENWCHAFVYGICDPWANVFQATSGICKENDKIYLASGRQKQPDVLPCATWHEADDFAWIGEGWAKAWRIQQNVNSVTMVPTQMGGNEGLLFGDYTWGAADGRRLPWRGGHFHDGGLDGALFCYWYTASHARIDYGARLTYQKAM